ncbi:MAG: hypothetical protein JWP81_350 [Ferruginibacter sp.]|nr:hypothetical protein [Ferruginibacter sp.]
MQKLLSIFLLISLHFFCGQLKAQSAKDPTASNTKKIADTSNKKIVKKFDPKKATRRSAILPGWGQIYNKKYWKLPLVYGALGITGGVFAYNVKNYKLLRLAYIYKIDTDTANDTLIDPRFTNLSAEALRSYRNSFRQNVDYSVLFFLVFWGLNVVDATVDGHLKEFDVNDNLSFQLKQGYSPMANTTGISLVLDIHSKKAKPGKYIYLSQK